MNRQGARALDPATTCADWFRLWSSFGFSDHQWTSRAAKVEEYTRKVLESKVLNYRELLSKRSALLKQSVEDYQDVILRTGLPSSIDKSVFDGLKLKEQEVYIDEQMQELLNREGRLIQQRSELERQQEHLCALLHVPPLEFDQTTVTPLVEINEKIESHIGSLTDLKDHRLTLLSSFYAKLKVYCEQLEWRTATPTLDNLLLQQFDRCLAADCLDEIERTIRQMEDQIEKQNDRFVTLREQLGHLYERLGKVSDADHCRAYKTGAEHIDASVIRQLEDEIVHCREERMKNGKEYRQSIRQQLLDLLEKAYLGDEERAMLDDLDSHSLSSDLLDAYDAHFERMSQLYEQRKPILDAYEKWLTFCNDFVAFTKASTDPGRFRLRGYNAQAEGRKRKKYLREFPIVEQDFLNALSNCDDHPFLINNIPIRQRFDDMHRQLAPSTTSSSTNAKTVVTTAPSQSIGLTPVKSRTIAVTPRRGIDKGQVGGGNTPLTSLARRLAKTPSAATGRKFLDKIPNHTEHQPKRAKPPPPPSPSSSPGSDPFATLPVHPPAKTDDQTLDFSLLHTMKNVHGHMKVMTSTPNSTLLTTDERNAASGKTAHNTIDRRRSKRRLSRTPVS